MIFSTLNISLVRLYIRYDSQCCTVRCWAVMLSSAAGEACKCHCAAVELSFSTHDPQPLLHSSICIRAKRLPWLKIVGKSVIVPPTKYLYWIYEFILVLPKGSYKLEWTNFDGKVDCMIRFAFTCNYKPNIFGILLNHNSYTVTMWIFFLQHTCF